MNTKRAKLYISFFVSVLLLGLLVTACQPQATEDASLQNTPASEMAVEEPAVEEPVVEEPMGEQAGIQFDPAGGADAQLVEGHLYETLIVVKGDDFFPWLAENGTVANDGLDYILELRPGVLFHDETVLDADAVIANFDRWFDLENALRGTGDFSAWKEAFGDFKGEVDADGNPKSSYDGIEKVNDLTVLIHLNQPDPDLFAKLSNPAFAIISPTALATGLYAGTGPYVIGEITTDSLSLIPFADYWGEVLEDEMLIDLE